MRVTILAFGSRGDVQPFLALAVGLKKQGYSVTLAAPTIFRSLVESNDQQFVPIAGDPEEISRILNSAGNNLFQTIHGLWDYAYRIRNDLILSVNKAIEGAELLIHGFAFTEIGHMLAQAAKIPDISIQMFPAFAPTRSFAAVGQPEFSLGLINYLGHWLNSGLFRVGTWMGRAVLNKEVKQLFQHPLRWPFEDKLDHPPIPLLFAISPSVLGDPPEWRNKQISIPGYFFLDGADYRAPEELSEFLAEGEPPICLTFGSMINKKSSSAISTILAAAKILNLRIIFISGWTYLPTRQFEQNVFIANSIPHEFIFSKCSVIIHHGGAGTSAASARSGIPQIIIPHIGDQFFWGNTMAKHKVCPPPIHINKINTDSITSALGFAFKQETKAAAHILGQRIRQEDGVGNAVKIITQYYEIFFQ